MRRLTACILLCTLGYVCGFSREWGTRWVSHPQPNDTSQVWFRKQVRSAAPLARGFVTVASAGRFKLYVNERNVAIDPFLHAVDSLEEVIHQYTFDVTRFLDGRETTIAVWYAPRAGRSSDKQLSLDFYGEDTRGRRFYEQADGSWWCKEASSACVTSESEHINGPAYDAQWLAVNANTKDWARAVDCTDTTTSPLRNTSPHYDGIQMRRILRCVAEQADSTGITFDFGRAFTGWVRITLRGAKKGERITIGQHVYTCSGKMDEQAFPRFTITRQRYVRLTGDALFRRSQIQNIEGVEIETYPHTHFLY